ncbi:hypothetical protein GCK32_010078, partial [Trichostrongylus colubriformis]
IFCFLLLPAVPRWILISLALLVLLVLIAGCRTLKPSLIITFLICNMLLNIPIFVVIYFTTFTLASYDLRDDHIFADCYQCWLYRQSTGFLWAGLIISFLSLIFDGVLTAGVRKLRLLSHGVTTVAVGHEQCHHHRPIIIEAPSRVVYATPAPTGVVMPGTNVYRAPVYPAGNPYIHEQVQHPEAQADPQPPYAPQLPPPYKP